MKQVIIKHGTGTVEEVPAPLVEPGRVLVRVDHSCISVGTEMERVNSSGRPLWKRAMNRPQNVRRVIDMARTEGLSRTRNVVQGQLASGAVSGYSASGVVLEVGEGIYDVQVGDRVACVGSRAHHAEIICVPRNLVVHVPEEIDLATASTVALGATALQGVRRLQPTLGETFVVIGLGFLGQLTVQMLKANGCRVVGADLDPECIKLALTMGLDVGLSSSDGSDVERVSRLTDGYGADGVIITAATRSDDVVSTAFKMCRSNGRVVLVGDVGLHLNRSDIYKKELDFFISSFCGPGRFEERYEEAGLDYPIAYVRWTENRNMAEYLRLLATGRVNVAPLISRIYPVDEAPAAYDALKSSEHRVLMVLLSYPAGADEAPVRSVRNPRAMAAGQGAVRVAVVGAGRFARGVHLPNLQQLGTRYHIRAIMSRQGHNAMATSRQYGGDYATTEYDRILDDPDIDAVIICTRHHLHAPMVLQALRAGKHVLIETPLALTREELAEIEAFYAERGDASPVLLTGFNRRFSPYAREIVRQTGSRSNPMILNYRMNAGYIPLTHWTHGIEGGGRNRGEACNIYDLFTALTGAVVTAVHAQAITPMTGAYSPSDNFVATLTFADGSIATLTYTALGSTDYPQEQLEVYCDGSVTVLDDYHSLVTTGARAPVIAEKTIDKGHMAELEQFAHVIRYGGEWPIPLWQQIQSTEIALRVEEQIRPDGMASPAAHEPESEVAATRVASPAID